jgi:hypothetical protein
LSAGKFAGLTIKVLLGGGFGTIDARAHLNHIEVDFHYAVLAPEKLYQNCPVSFTDLPGAGAGAECEYVLCGLLRYGAATTDFGPFVQVIITHLADLFPIKTVMLIELLVLGQNYGLGKLM